MRGSFGKLTDRKGRRLTFTLVHATGFDLVSPGEETSLAHVVDGAIGDADNHLNGAVVVILGESVGSIVHDAE